MRVPPARVRFPAEDRAEILARIDNALSTGQLTLGPIGRELEAAFAKRHATQHAVAVSSGTSALEIILRALDVEGREVIVPANTFFATAAAAVHAGARCASSTATRDDGVRPRRRRGRASGPTPRPSSRCTSAA